MALDMIDRTSDTLLRPAVPPYAGAGLPAIELVSALAMSASVPPPQATWAPGAMIPGTVYRVIRPLGAGGMGEVYEAEHELLGVRRALKVLTRRLADREDLAERLRIEARALARLKHPNLVEVNDLGTSSDGRVFFAMELLVGATLRDMLRRSGALRDDQAVSVAMQILDALDAAHEQGMVHRDVKPENVFIQRSGVVKLLDFGVAKALQGPGQVPVAALTAAGVAIGTPRYMSPEQAAGAPIDARSDVYAVGVVLQEMLTGQPPYAHLDALAAAVAAATRGLPSLDEVGATHVSPEVRAVLERATALEPGKRYPSASSFASALRLIHPRLSSPGHASAKITARYDQSPTALVPVMGNLTDPDPTAIDGLPLGASGPDAIVGATGQGPLTGAGLTAPGFVTATGEGYAQVMTSELEVPAPTEVLLLRSSLPFDHREMPTPTAVPLAPRASSPSLPAVAPLTTPAPVAPSSARRLSWLALPIGMALSALGTWALVRSPAPASVAPAVVTTTSVSVTALPSAPAVTASAAPAAPATAPVEPAIAAPSASSPTAPTPAASVAARPVSTGGKPATKPATRVTTKPGGKTKPPQIGSGL